MTFAARGVVVSLAFFAMVYCSLSLLIVLAWRSARRISRDSISPRSIPHSAGFLFGLRIFSFAVSVLIAVFFAFPSFWRMENATLDEDGATFILAACALLILGAGWFRVRRARASTKRAVTEWQSEVGNVGSSGAEGAPALRASNGAPALILVGIRKPKVMVSDLAAAVLSEDELRLAIRHELGHKRSLDNLKKVLISATPFPGMSSLESAWRHAAELEADDDAVENRQNALDLAAALIKLSCSSKHGSAKNSSAKNCSEPALASALVSDSSAITLRVQRLLEWRMAARRRQRVWPFRVLSTVLLLAVIAAIATNYGATLALTHRLTELLVP